MIKSTIFLLSFLLTFNLIYFILDDLSLSKNKFIRISQILSPLFFILIIYFSFIDVQSSVNSVLYMAENGNNDNTKINIGANITLDKEAGKQVAKGISNLGQNLGLSTTIASVVAGTGKLLVKSSLPVVQKTGILLTSAAVGAGIHVGASVLNKNYDPVSSSISSNSTLSSSVNDSTDKAVETIVKKFVEDSSNSDLTNLLLSINTITSACLILVIILLSVILFRVILDENKINLKLSNILGENLNNNLNLLIIKLIRLNKKSSLVIIFYIFFVLIIGLSASTYFTTFLLSHLDSFIYGHINKQ